MGKAAGTYPAQRLQALQASDNGDYPESCCSRLLLQQSAPAAESSCSSACTRPEVMWLSQGTASCFRVSRCPELGIEAP